MAKSVKVYSTSTCPWCVRAKQFLQENNVLFENIDLSDNQSAREELMRKTGQIGVPVLDIDGQIIVGFDRERIKLALGI
ncbi:MAG: glutathione S-transferase N-terminal domain-containing protein [Candidatus Omnitrophica bacterium]|jgi:glutaredoxin-like YruB-family protein|nr:glutathione S-transferase N-terminal domain-containing protein [Candidatus Omnitrophota bacterium]